MSCELLSLHFYDCMFSSPILKHNKANKIEQQNGLTFFEQTHSSELVIYV